MDETTLTEESRKFGGKIGELAEKELAHLSLPDRLRVLAKSLADSAFVAKEAASVFKDN